VRYVDSDGREDEIVIKTYIPTAPKREETTSFTSVTPSANYK